MRTKTGLALLILSTVCAFSCETAEEAFVGDRLNTLCDEAYWICDFPSGCVLDEDHYVKGLFPGVRRVAVDVDDPETKLKIRIFLSEMESPGTELLVQAYETDCTLNTTLAREQLIDVDIFEKAGEDRMLSFDLEVLQAGEHLVELYSDASAEYLFYIEQK